MSNNILLGKLTGHKEQLSPYKLMVLLIMDEHMSYLDSMTDSIACSLMFTLLELINASDMTLEGLLNKVRPILSQLAMESLLNRMSCLQKNGLDGMFELMQSLPERLLEEPYNVYTVDLDKSAFTSSLDPFINKNSIFGLFLRRVNLAFEMMSFHEATLMHSQLREYLQSYPTSTTENSQNLSAIETTDVLTESDLLCTEDEDLSSCNYSRSLINDVKMPSHRQSEFFIAQQANLLNFNEHLALPTTDLQHSITHLLTHNPQLHQTHYLQYMNMLRVKEYKASFDSLYNFFDRSYISNHLPSQSSSETPHDDLNNHRLYRYAALNIAIAHYRFGHRLQAMLALQEAIKIAHQTNDSVCLQYALDWLHRLGMFEKDTEQTDGAYLLTKLIQSARDFNLPNLMSTACLSNAKDAFIKAANPAFVLESTSLSDLNTGSTLMLTSSSHKASLCSAYGHDELCMMNSLILLETTSSITSSLTSKSPSLSSITTLMPSQGNTEEMECLAYCHLCRLLAKEGYHNESMELLETVKKKYPQHCIHSSVWMLCQHQIFFSHFILQGNLKQAEQCIRDIASINGLESSYCRCLYYAECGELNLSINLLETVIRQVSSSHLEHFLAKCFMLKGCLLMLLREFSSSLDYLCKAHKISKSNHYHYLQAVALCNLASLQLKLGRPHKAREMIKLALPKIFQNQHLLHQASALFIYVNCCIQTCHKDQSDLTIENIQNGTENNIINKKGSTVDSTTRQMIELMGVIRDKFERVKALSRLRECLIYQCLVLHRVGMIEERNRTSSRLRLLSAHKHKYHFASIISMNLI